MKARDVAVILAVSLFTIWFTLVVTEDMPQPWRKSTNAIYCDSFFLDPLQKQDLCIGNHLGVSTCEWYIWHGCSVIWRPRFFRYYAVSLVRGRPLP